MKRYNLINIELTARNIKNILFKLQGFGICKLLNIKDPATDVEWISIQSAWNLFGIEGRKALHEIFREDT